MSLDNLPALNFEETDKKFEEILKRISNVSIIYDLCLLRAKQYKFLSQIKEINEEIKTEIKKRANYYLQEAEKYKEM